MALENWLILIASTVLLLPFILAIGVIVVIVTSTWSKVVRNGYVNMLLAIFDVRFPLPSMKTYIKLCYILLHDMFAVWKRQDCESRTETAQ